MLTDSIFHKKKLMVSTGESEVTINLRLQDLALGRIPFALWLFLRKWPHTTHVFFLEISRQAGHICSRERLDHKTGNSVPYSLRMVYGFFKVPHNLVPRAFLRRGEDGREKTLASADHVIFKHPEKLGVIN